MSPLDTLLNQVAYVNRKRVKDDIKSAIEEYKSLLPKISKFVQNNGVETKIVSLSGTIPIKYNGVQYNLPIEIFVVDRYPQSPPKAYLRPTPTMQVKPNHRHADMQGCVYLPYLHEWTQNSTLVALIEICSNVFSFDPPLFTKPAGIPAPMTTTGTVVSAGSTTNRGSFSNPTNYSSAVYAQPVSNPTNAQPIATATPYGNSYGQPGAYSSTNFNGTPNFNGTSNYGGTTNTATFTPAVGATAVGVASVNHMNGSYLQPSPSNTYSTTSNNYTTSNPYPNNNYQTSTYPNNSNNHNNHNNNNNNAIKISPAEKHENLILEVTNKIQQEIDKEQQRLKKDLDQEFFNQRYLERSEQQLTTTRRDITTLLSQLQKAFLTIQEKKLALEQWDHDESSKGKPDLEELIISYDDLSNQIIRLNAELNAIDDIFYFLERSLVNKKIDCGSFLRESRQLARKQFISKGHLLKIQQQLTNMFPPPPVPSQQLPPQPNSHSGSGVNSPQYFYAPGSGTGSPMNLTQSVQQNPAHTLVRPQVSLSSQQQIQSQYPGLTNSASGPFLHGMNQHATNRSQPSPVTIINNPVNPTNTNNGYNYYSYK